jgi:hypothetical protein
MLVGSWPAGANKDDYAALTTWWAESKDHWVPDPHRLRAYAMGLRIAGMSQSRLKAQLYTVAVTSPVAAWPEAAAPLREPASDVLVGGGARAFGTAGQLLVSSLPEAGRGWVAKSKDHVAPDPGTITAITIGAPRCLRIACLAGGNCLTMCLALTSDRASGFAVDTGYATASDLNETGGVVTSCAGAANAAGNGRLLTQLMPRINDFDGQIDGGRGAVTVVSKDHVVPAEGNNTASAVALRVLE